MDMEIGSNDEFAAELLRRFASDFSGNSSEDLHVGGTSVTDGHAVVMGTLRRIVGTEVSPAVLDLILNQGYHPLAGLNASAVDQHGNRTSWPKQEARRIKAVQTAARNLEEARAALADAQRRVDDEERAWRQVADELAVVRLLIVGRAYLSVLAPVMAAGPIATLLLSVFSEVVSGDGSPTKAVKEEAEKLSGALASLVTDELFQRSLGAIVRDLVLTYHGQVESGSDEDRAAAFAALEDEGSEVRQRVRMIARALIGDEHSEEEDPANLLPF